MAFCNSCGATQDAGARFCPKCGTPTPAGAGVSASAAPVSQPQAQSNSALKIVLIVVAAIVALGVIGVGTATFIAMRIARHSRIENRDGNVRVQTPFGSVQSSDNADEAARNLGIDLYPGAEVVKGNMATIGGMRTVEVEFESNDSARKINSFYTAKFPNANVTSKDSNQYTIVSTDKKNLITINIEPDDGKTRIKIASVSGKNVTGDNSSE